MYKKTIATQRHLLPSLSQSPQPCATPWTALRSFVFLFLTLLLVLLYYPSAPQLIMAASRFLTSTAAAIFYLATGAQAGLEQIDHVILFMQGMSFLPSIYMVHDS